MPVPVSRPTSVALLMLVSIMNSIQLNICGIASGMTALAMTCGYVAPVALNASTVSFDASSIVSMNTRTRKPNVAKNSARNPVAAFVPKLMTRISAHATTGMLRETEAVSLAAYINTGFTAVSFDPMIAKMPANTAAVVVDTIEIRIVSQRRRSTFGRLDSVLTLNSMLAKSHWNAAGIDMTPSM